MLYFYYTKPIYRLKLLHFYYQMINMHFTFSQKTNEFHYNRFRRAALNLFITYKQNIIFLRKYEILIRTDIHKAEKVLNNKAFSLKVNITYTKAKQIQINKIKDKNKINKEIISNIYRMIHS